MVEKLCNISKKYDFESEVVPEEYRIIFTKGKEVIDISIYNSGIEGEVEGTETILFYYDRKGTHDKSFDLNLTLELVNSISNREFTQEECKSFLASKNTKYQEKCTLLIVMWTYIHWFL